MIWWHKDLQNGYTMADISVANLTPKDVKKVTEAIRGIDPNGEIGITIKFVTMFVFFV